MDSLEFVSEYEADFIRQDVKDVMESFYTKVDIVYRYLGARSFSVTTGVVTPTYTDSIIDAAFKGNHSAREIGQSGGTLKIGDQFFMFDPKLIDTPTSDDIILEGLTDDGRVKVVGGSTAVVGYKTKFMELGIQGGDLLEAEVGIGVKQSVRIKSVTNDEALVLVSNWATSKVAAEFKIYRVYTIVNQIIDPLRAACRMSVRRAGA